MSLVQAFRRLCNSLASAEVMLLAASNKESEFELGHVPIHEVTAIVSPRARPQPQHDAAHHTGLGVEGSTTLETTSQGVVTQAIGSSSAAAASPRTRCSRTASRPTV